MATITLQTLDKRVVSLETKVSSLEEKIDSLEHKMETGFADLRTTIGNSITDSIDGLAIMLKQNFDQIEERFKKVDERFDQINERFNRVDKQFDHLEYVTVGSHERRIENLEDDMRTIKTKISLK